MKDVLIPLGFLLFIGLFFFPFRPEIQIRGTRVAVYPADRNESVESVADAGLLLDYAKSVATVHCWRLMGDEAADGL